MSSHYLRGIATGITVCSYYIVIVGTNTFNVVSLVTWMMLALTALLFSLVKSVDERKGE